MSRNMNAIAKAVMKLMEIAEEVEDDGKELRERLTDEEIEMCLEVCVKAIRYVVGGEEEEKTFYIF